MIKFKELKSCPFCEVSCVGRINYTDEVIWIECSNCKAETGGKPSLKQAIVEWNNSTRRKHDCI